MNTKGIAVAGLVGTIVAVVVSILVGYTMFGSVSDAKNPCATYNASNHNQCYTWTNSTPIATSESSFLSLGTLFLALGIGVLGLKLLTDQ